MNIRNLEQIQEDESRARPSRLGTLLLASVAGAALVIVAVMMRAEQGPPARSADDPLAQLVAQAKRGTPPEQLDRKDVTFPALLSDEQNPTTALAAVKDERGRLLRQPEDTPLDVAPPPPGDRLPVVPLPAAQLLSATPVTTAPKDALTALAAGAVHAESDAEPAPSGTDGGFQLQVASFKDGSDAEAFVAELRRRGHRAYSQAAYVPDRGLWHRVRIGPFKTKFEANQYRSKFEKTERVSPFVIDPSKVKQEEETRAKLRG